LDQLEKRDPNDGPSDLIVRPPGGELDLYKPEEDDDSEKPSKAPIPPKNPRRFILCSCVNFIKRLVILFSHIQSISVI
jgi:hypothetical protein